MPSKPKPVPLSEVRLSAKEKRLFTPSFVRKSVKGALASLKKPKLAEMPNRQLMGTYASAVRLAWSTRDNVRKHAGHNPDYQRELALKREIMRRLEKK